MKAILFDPEGTVAIGIATPEEAAGIGGMTMEELSAGRPAVCVVIIKNPEIGPTPHYVVLEASDAQAIGEELLRFAATAQT